MNIDKLRELCLSFPGATEGVKWEDHLCFMVAEKMFCVTGEDGRVSLKVTMEEFEELTERPDITPTKYMARNRWITIQRPGALKPKEWVYYVTQSYRLIRDKLPKKVQAELK